MTDEYVRRRIAGACIRTPIAYADTQIRISGKIFLRQCSAKFAQLSARPQFPIPVLLARRCSFLDRYETDPIT
jgi:hypothetical protein